MLHVFGILGVGGPGPVLGQGWDAAPLLLAAMLAIVLVRAHHPFRLGALLAISLLGGTALDLVDDAVGISTATSVVLLALALAVVAMRRRRTA